MYEMHAKETTYPMEGDGLGTITHFDFEAMVHSLLSDPHIAKSLIINRENPNERGQQRGITIRWYSHR